MAQGSLVKVYAAVSFCSAVLIFRENAHYMSGNIVVFVTDFVKDASSNHAARSMSLDLLLLSVSACIWMLREAKRLRIRHAWLYIVGGIVTAIAITFPLFMIHREYRLRQSDGPSS
ncbi:MAG: DUF2834 domain-containing protein [Labilithrix sp.]|nr:DUF2834 domain-containing protein [Labilithrix sp.]